MEHAGAAESDRVSFATSLTLCLCLLAHIVVGAILLSAEPFEGAQRECFGF